LVILCNQIYAQSISGFVYDETNAPVPFANVYLKNTQRGTAADAQGKYYLQLNDPGVIDLVFTAVGYETQELKIKVLHQENLVKNVWLKVDELELEEVSISARRRDPAYDIIAKAIDNKERWNSQFASSTCEVYIKAAEVISEKEKKKREKEKKQEELEEKRRKNEETEEDPDAIAKREHQAPINKIAGSRNMAEVQMTRYYQRPNSIKEIREGFKKYGSSYGLFYTSTNEADFNFYDNLMSMGNLNELPVISPLHPTSILTYKFKLEETIAGGDEFIYRISVTPRKKGNATWEGEIFIVNNLYYLEKVDLSLSEEGLMIYRDFNIKQEFEMNKYSLVLLKRQEFDYSSKDGRTTFTGNTIARYENYEINPTFEKRFFKNEVAVTTQEAYDRDSTYWDRIRPEPLTPDEQRYQHVKDSIIAVTTSEVYLDSLDSAYNRITFLDIIWEGVGFSNRMKKQFIYFPSIPAFLNPFEIGGLRLGPSAYYFKKWKNEKSIGIGGRLDVGVRNMDVKGSLSVSYRFDPMHLGTVGAYGGKMFNTIVDNDAVTFLFQRSNWIEEYRFNPYVTREIVNGLQGTLIVEYVDRLPIDQYQFGPLTEDWFGGNEPLKFTRYQTVIANFKLQYTPFQKYMTEPYRKVVLGSKWPTFEATYRRGIPDIFGSDINFDYTELSIRQNFKFRTLGTSSYHVKTGKFFNKQDLRYVDYKIFPRGDRYFFASLMQSMQIQDTTLYANDLFVQAHYVHHFNGAFMNLIPLVNKLGIHTVVGASGLWIKDSGYQYGEWFAGAERYFKASRARWRIGVYYVDAVSNFSRIKPHVKFAINRYSLRDQSWGY
jgi:hypothetical protein